MLLFIALFSGLNFAVVIESFLGLGELIAASGLVARETLDGLVLAVAPIERVESFDEDLGFDIGQGAVGALEEPVGLNDLVEEMSFEIACG